MYIIDKIVNWTISSRLGFWDKSRFF